MAVLGLVSHSKIKVVETKFTPLLESASASNHREELLTSFRAEAQGSAFETGPLATPRSQGHPRSSSSTGELLGWDEGRDPL